MFSFVLLDESVTPPRIIAARDPIGITTLYQGWSSTRPGATFFASELKALVDECDKIISFPPGHVYDSRDQSTTRYFNPTWWNGDETGPTPTASADLKLLRETLEAAVRKRLMSEVPYGVLLSGGLDSSLIAAIAARETEKVSQAQYEARQRKLQEVSSGPSTPNPGLVSEQGEQKWKVKATIRSYSSFQRLLRLGLGYTHSLSALKIPPTYWQPERQPIIFRRSTTSMYSPSRRDWTPFPRLYII